jgi:putative Ca2+/H+ antiporter (TMEM165/GDT1 family)
MLAAFTAGLLLITISELGDKTFCIALLLAMRHSRQLVASAAIAALATMTLLSVLLGQAVALLPKAYIHYGEIVVFICFGLKLLYDAYRLPHQSKDAMVEDAAVAIREQCDLNLLSRLATSVQSQHLTVWLQGFTLVLLAEWGDRTQFSTVALSASYNPIGVILGAISGHGICTAIAVLGGRLIAGRISERTVTAIGGILFLIFGIVAVVS